MNRINIWISILTITLYVLTRKGFIFTPTQELQGQIVGLLVIYLLLAVAFRIYMIPANHARQQNHPSAGVIRLVNLFMGWMILPWLVCLVIACNGSKNPATLANSLKELDDLRHKKQITDEEYTTKRALLLS